MSDSEILISVEHVSKKFCRSLKRSLWYGLNDMAAEALGGAKNHDQLRKNEFWAVKDVNFKLRRGECLGLIGGNGAGKTTLLKMLNGLIKPDHGRIEMRGRVGALIALGAGFNPILTGRENIYINGSVLGLTKKEIDAKVEEIIDFADIRQFIDSPVQNYSSGMQVRLGFAVASALDPDILIADEVLAVGDANFRAKCYRKLADLRNLGTTILLVSHQMSDIQRVCTTCVWLLDGGVAQSGETAKVVSEYLVWSDMQTTSQISTHQEPTQPKLSGARIVAVHTFTTGGHPASAFKTGEDLRVRIEFEVDPAIEGLNFSVSINSNHEALYNGYASLHDGLTIYPSKSRDYVDLVFPKLCLGAGTYWLNVGLSDKNYFGVYDWRWQTAQFSVANDKPMLGRFAFPHFWETPEPGSVHKFPPDLLKPS